VLLLVARAVVAIVANAIALVVTAQVLDDMSLGASGLLVAVVVFTVVAVLIEPALRQMALRSAPAILGSTALIATLISLVVTVLVTDSMSISGGLTWILATIMVWVLALLARMVLPLIIFKRTLGEARDRRS
jgi:hypothetical protein